MRVPGHRDILDSMEQKTRFDKIAQKQERRSGSVRQENSLLIYGIML